MAPPANPDTTELLVRARSGDGAAVGSLLEVYRNQIALLLRVQVGPQLRTKIDVEDVVQETFLEAHRNIGRFAGQSRGELLVWLRQIAAGVLANQLRRYLGTKRRDVRLEQSLIEGFDRSSAILDAGLIAQGSSPSQRASRRELGILLANALAALPPDYREVIILRHLEDLPFPEVAQRMGRTLDSVKNLWVRALARLRRQMETYQ
ncbi:MAG: sigma-70 family RNA polymerase sigma factor [Isosphaeraceae bacterium]